MALVISPSLTAPASVRLNPAGQATATLSFTLSSNMGNTFARVRLGISSSFDIQPADLSVLAVPGQTSPVAVVATLTKKAGSAPVTFITVAATAVECDAQGNERGRPRECSAVIGIDE